MQDETKKRNFVIGLIVASSILPLGFINHPLNNSNNGIALYLSAIAGYMGVSLLVWMYILGTRSVTQYFFQDLAPLIKIHSWIGKYGTLLIFLHPIFIIFSYGESLLYILLPDTGTTFQNHVTLGRIALYLLLIIWVSSALLRDKIAYRPWKYIHYLSYIILPFALIHIPNVGSTYMQQATAKAYFLGVIATLVAFSFIRIYSLLNLDKIKYTVVENRVIAPGTYQLRLRTLGVQLTPKAGQFVYLKIGYISEDHPFSVLYSDHKTGEIVIAYKHYQSFTKEMTKLTATNAVWLSGPYGSFTHQLHDTSDHAPTVFIAGGIGITPFVNHLITTSDREQWLFYTNPTPENAAYLSELRAQLGDKLVGLFRSKDEQQSGEIGYVEAATFQRHLADPLAYQYFICGPPPMIATATENLKSIGVQASSIHQESFSF